MLFTNPTVSRTRVCKVSDWVPKCGTCGDRAVIRDSRGCSGCKVCDTCGSFLGCWNLASCEIEKDEDGEDWVTMLSYSFGPPRPEWKEAPDSSGFWWMLHRDNSVDIQAFYGDADGKFYWLDDEGYVNYPYPGQLFLKQPEPALPCLE